MPCPNTAARTSVPFDASVGVPAAGRLWPGSRPVGEAKRLQQLANSHGASSMYTRLGNDAVGRLRPRLDSQGYGNERGSPLANAEARPLGFIASRAR
jgi:hypothetical protein